MALIKCPACGHEVSDQASFCPNCGQPIKTATADVEIKSASEDTEISDFSELTRVPRKVIFYYLTIIVLSFGILTFPTVLLHHWADFFWSLFIIIGIPVWIYLSLEVLAIRFELSQDKIDVSKGILSRRSTSVPFYNAQSVTTGAGPILGLFKLKKFAIWTSSPSQMVIRDGESENRPDIFLILNRTDAERIREYALNSAKRP